MPQIFTGCFTEAAPMYQTFTSSFTEAVPCTIMLWCNVPYTVSLRCDVAVPALHGYVQAERYAAAMEAEHRAAQAAEV